MAWMRGGGSRRRYRTKPARTPLSDLERVFALGLLCRDITVVQNQRVRCLATSSASLPRGLLWRHNTGVGQGTRRVLSPPLALMSCIYDVVMVAR